MAIICDQGEFQNPSVRVELAVTGKVNAVSQ